MPHPDPQVDGGHNRGSAFGWDGKSGSRVLHRDHTPLGVATGPEAAAVRGGALATEVAAQPPGA